MVLFTFDALDKKSTAPVRMENMSHRLPSKREARCTFLKQNEKTGLDPFKIFLEEGTNEPDRKTVSEFLSMLLNEAREPELRTDLRLACEKSSSFEDLLANSPRDLKKQLDADLKPYRFLFEGEPVQLRLENMLCYELSS